MLWFWLTGSGHGSGYLLALVLTALLVDRFFGEPAILYKKWGHPIQWIGWFIDWLEQRCNRARYDHSTRRCFGGLCLALVLATVILPTALISWAAGQWNWGWVVEGSLAAVFLAHHSLCRHVRAVATNLQAGIEPGRRAVAQIVGRDPDVLDRPAVGRAAIESLAENYADGVIAPLFWLLVFGLPGLVTYKAINTADSMIGHRTRRHRDFGRTAARVDDAVNWLPARLTAVLLSLTALRFGWKALHRAVKTVLRDAPQHRSPNAGWPEAATAGALGLALAGPRIYHGRELFDHWMGNGRSEVTIADIRRAVGFVDTAHWLVITGVIGSLALL